MDKDIYIPQGVNPHQDREWALMCAGSKPAALFALHLEVLPREFAGAHEFVERTVSIESPAKNRRRQKKPLIFKIFTQKTASDKAEKLAKILQNCYAPGGKITPEAEKTIGMLLGYDPQDIDIYLKWVRQFKDSLYLPEKMPTQGV